MTWISASPRANGRFALYLFPGCLIGRATMRVRPLVLLPRRSRSYSAWHISPHSGGNPDIPGRPQGVAPTRVRPGHTPAISLRLLASPFVPKGDDDRRVYMSAPTRWFVSGLLPGLPGGRSGSQGLRSRKDRSSPRASAPAGTSAPSLSIASSGCRKSRPRRGVRCCAERVANR